MKFEIKNPSEVNKEASPWPGAVREQHRVWVTRFVPLSKGMDGTPHSGKDGVFMMMCGSYQKVLEPSWIWTIEIETIEKLVEMFDGLIVSISESRSPDVSGLIEFEDVPSYVSSYS